MKGRGIPGFCLFLSCHVLMVIGLPYNQPVAPVARTSPDIQPKPLLIRPSCEKPIDMVISVDTSGSMISDLQDVIDDAEHFALNFKITEEGPARVAVIDFSAVSNVYKALDTNNTEQRVYEALEQIRNKPQNGETWPELALDRAADIFSKAMPQKVNSSKVMVIFTDGEFSGQEKEGVVSLMNNMRLQNITVYVVGVKNDHYQHDGIKMLATSSNHVYNNSSLPPLGRPTLTDAICYDVYSQKGFRPLQPGTPLLSPPPILYSPQQPQAVGDAPQKKEEPTKTTMPSQYATELPNKAPHIQPTLAPPNDAPFTAPYGLAPQPLPIKLVQPAPVLTSPPVTPPPVRPPPLTLVLEPGESNGRPYPVPPIITNPKPHNETHPVKLVHDLDQALTLNITGGYSIAVGYNNKTGGFNGTIIDPNNELPFIYKPNAVKMKDEKEQTTDTGKEPHREDCLLPLAVGMCKAAFERFYYDAKSGRCLKFTYGGCGGNANNFPSEKECFEKCKGVKIEENTSHITPTPQALPSIGIDGVHEPTKCRSMRDYSLKRNQTPVLCDADGRFSALQADFSLGYIWCVNQDSGLEIYGTRKLSGGAPVKCAGTNKNVEQPKTKCESEREEAKKKMHMIPDLPVPVCSAVDGLYEEIQWSPFGWSWCVDRYSGELINGTMTEETSSHLKPLCPKKSQCELEREKAITYNYRNAEVPPGPIFVPDCQVNGNYNKVQWQMSDGVAWCVDEYTGKEVEGTRTRGHADQLPVCPESPVQQSNGKGFYQTTPSTFTVQTAQTIQPLTTSSTFTMVGKGFTQTTPPTITYQQMNGKGLTQTAPPTFTTMTYQQTNGKGLTQTTPKEPLYPEPEPALTPENGLYSAGSPPVSPEGAPPQQPLHESPDIDIYNPSNLCSIEVDFAKQRKLSGVYKFVFVPQCDSAGNYLAMQKNERTGDRWCVQSPLTGKAVQSTITKIGQPDPDCKFSQPSDSAMILAASAAPMTTMQETTTTLPTTLPPTTLPPTTLTLPTTTATTRVFGTATNSSNTTEEVHTTQTTTQHTNGSCQYTIGSNLVKLGCLRDSRQIPQPLPVHIVSKSEEGKTAFKDKERWSTFIRELVCECATETQKKGWFTFGIQNYGDCYSGPDEGRYAEDGKARSDQCLDEQQNECNIDDEHACAGIPKPDPNVQNMIDYANAVFMIKTETHKNVVYIEYDRRRRHAERNFHLHRHHKHRRDNKL
ncbi:uncharacterized protein [Clytia hemisphaerica]|uniref:Uncharacterized protein n=1 Tax=Clytia hemisphaerica TaxID=252671 RepID=A0A7M5X4U3_9CNID